MTAVNNSPIFEPLASSKAPNMPLKITLFVLGLLLAAGGVFMYLKHMPYAEICGASAIALLLASATWSVIDWFRNSEVILVSTNPEGQPAITQEQFDQIMRIFPPVQRIRVDLRAQCFRVNEDIQAERLSYLSPNLQVLYDNGFKRSLDSTGSVPVFVRKSKK